MRRKLFNVVAAISMAMCVANAVLWVKALAGHSSSFKRGSVSDILAVGNSAEGFAFVIGDLTGVRGNSPFIQEWRWPGGFYRHVPGVRWSYLLLLKHWFVLL